MAEQPEADGHRQALPADRTVLAPEDAQGDSTEEVRNAWACRLQSRSAYHVRKTHAYAGTNELLVVVPDFLDDTNSVLMASVADPERVLIVVRERQDHGSVVTGIEASDRYASGKRLRRLHGVSSVEETERGLRVMSEGTDGLLSEVVREADGFGLRDVQIVEPSLETVFIRLTGRDLRE